MTITLENDADADADTDTFPKFDHAAIERDIAAGAKMFSDLLRRAGDDWNRWSGTILALRGLRSLASEKSGSTNVRSQAHRNAMSELLKLRKHSIFTQMDNPTRSNCYQLMDHLEEIDEWYASLPRNDKLAWKHPTTIVKHCPKELLARGLKGHNKPPKKGPKKKKGNPEAEALRALLIYIIDKYVQSIDPEEAATLRAKLYQSDPDDSLDNLNIDDDEGEEENEPA